MNRPLDAVTVGISISSAGDLHRYALVPQDVNRVTIEVCRRLIALGAHVLLGHDWRPGGVMDAMTQFAQAYQTSESTTIIRNYTAWPDRAALSEHERTRLSKLVKIVEQVRRPEFEGPAGRPRALRAMREQMTATNHARLCMSGASSPGGIPGVLEEAVLTLASRKALYLTRMMGGAAAWLVDVVQRRTNPETVPLTGEYIDVLRTTDEPQVARLSGLSIDELRQLFDAQNLDTVIHLTTRGLHTLRHEGRLPAGER